MIRALCLALGLSALPLLSGCGFSPMHATGSDATQLSGIAVVLDKGDDVADNQAGFFITQRLRDRIGNAPASAPYTLAFVPSYSRRRLGITDADVASRYDVTVRALWSLRETATGDVIKKGSTSAITTFGAPAGPFGVITADNVGIEQAAKETADRLIIEMAQILRDHSKS